jgi:aerobic C4-dicarboxylate transport protein
VATFVVAKWEGQFDREAMLRAFAGGDAVTDSAGDGTTPAVAGQPGVATVLPGDGAGTGVDIAHPGTAAGQPAPAAPAAAR